jgi:hypothetical protein
LENDIQRDIEDEISKEILHLSQTLANLQARYGAQRMLDHSLPAVLNCLVTPVLTPRIKHWKADCGSKKEDGIGDDGCCNKRGVVTPKVFQRNANWTPKSRTNKKINQRRQVYGQGCARTLNMQKIMKKESLGWRCRSSNENIAMHSCAPFRESEQQVTHEEKLSHHGDNSLFGTLSSSSIRSTITDYTHNKSKARPQVFPDNNKRFDSMKTLRFGKTSIWGSLGSIISKQPLKLLAPRKHLGEDLEFESKICLNSVE